MIPLFDKAHDRPTPFVRLVGWNGNWKCLLRTDERPLQLDSMVSLDPSDDRVLIVQQGRTLSELVAKYGDGATVDEVAKYNNIPDPNVIRVGQRIRIPAWSYRAPETTPTAPKNAPPPCAVKLSFTDVILKPLVKLKVRLTSASGEMFDTVTDEAGQIADYMAKAGEELKISVIQAAGKIKDIGTYTPSPDTTSEITLVSPKVKISGVSSSINGQKGTVTIDPHPMNSVVTGRDPQGMAVTVLTHPCLDKDNLHDLNLNANYEYYGVIVSAAERSGLLPQVVAALIDTEAGKDQHTHKWLVNAQNPRGSASGLTQFITGTWMAETMRKGSWLHDKAVALGYVALLARTPTITEQLIRPKVHRYDEYHFNMYDKEWVTEKDLIREVRHPTAISQGENKYTAWLALRCNPEYSVNAAVDYAQYNLSILRNKGIDVDGLNNADQAKVIYMAHQLGGGNAYKFIQEEITPEVAERLLTWQIGEEKAQILISQKDNDKVLAHRIWLFSFIDQHIIPENFYCVHLSHVSPLPKPRGLNFIVRELKK